MKIVYVNFVFPILICAVISAPQYPEINDQFEESNHTEIQKHETKNEQKPEVLHSFVQTHSEVEHTEIENNTVGDDTQTTELTTIKQLTKDTTEIKKPVPINFMAKVYKIVTGPIIRFMYAPKVTSVITNIGTCLVNGAMEIISFYLPAPVMPLIASAAGLLIPFEPVVLLREKMPVASYRRAFQTALKGFLGTFDKYKYEEEDPYMTGRFNRRFMGVSKEKNEERDT